MFTLSFLFLKFKETTSLAPVTDRPKRNGWEDDYEVVEDFLPTICYGDDPVKCLGPRWDFWGNVTTTSQNSRYVTYQCLSMLINHQLYCIWTPFPCLRNWFLTLLIPLKLDGFHKFSWSQSQLSLAIGATKLGRHAVLGSLPLQRWMDVSEVTAETILFNLRKKRHLKEVCLGILCVKTLENSGPIVMETHQGVGTINQCVKTVCACRSTDIWMLWDIAHSPC